MIKQKKKVVVAMSGGVDSSVSAAILKKQDFNVIGIFLKFWSPGDDKKAENKCCSVEAAEGARKVAQKLDIPFYVLDYQNSFRDLVVDYFISEYSAGRTPNPCVACNQFIKFGKLLKEAKKLGAEFLATGHYIRLRRINLKSQISNLKSFHLLEAKDKQKDQSYFLWTLTQEQLKHLIFPIGDFTKKQVRQMAKKWQLPTAERPESQEICFIYGTVKEFLQKYLKTKPGKILNKNRKVIGEHEGAIFYTVGQRRDLPIKPKTSEQKPLYVVKTDIKKNLIIVSEEKDLYSKELVAEKVNWIQSIDNKQLTINNLKARIRYGHPKEDCTILPMANSQLKIIFKKPQRAITSGQSVVFYREDQVLGGGVIK